MFIKNEYLRCLSYLTLGALTILPNYMNVNVLFQVFIHTVLLVYIGSVNSLKAFDKTKEQEVEVFQHKDAYMFPVIGSIVLFSLYLIFTYLDKSYLNPLFQFYFSLIGAWTIGMMLYDLLISLKTCQNMAKIKLFKIPAIPYIIEEACDIFLLDLLTFSVGLSVGFSYFFYKNWMFNNLLGIAFSVYGIESLMLGKVKIGLILLSLLFFYDIFWVFGTPVMVTVAKNLDGPIKLMFPKVVNYETQKDFNMIGLGDIVLPGAYVALMLRYDVIKFFNRKMDQAKSINFGFSNLKYFWCTLLGYALAIVLTLFVMVFFQAAQPALLYLVPGVFIFSFVPALLNGDFKEMLNHSEEEFITKPEEEKATAKLDEKSVKKD